MTGLALALMLAMWADIRFQLYEIRRRLDEHLEEPYHGTERRKSHA